MRPACIADLHLSETAKNAPAGDLHTYVLDMAENEPDMFGTSIVFSPGEKYYRKNAEGEKVYEGEDGFDEIGGKQFAEIRKLHACDAVDEPAANDGLFSAFSGDSLAAQVTEFLDLNPAFWAAVQANPDGLIEALHLHRDQFDEFVGRYSDYRDEMAEDAGATGEVDYTEAPSMDFLTNENFLALCERLGVEIPEDADDEFVAGIFGLAGDKFAARDDSREEIEAITLDKFETEEALKAQVAELEAALTEATESFVALSDALATPDEDVDIAELAESDDPRVQALLRENADMQEELDTNGRELSEKREAEAIATVKSALNEAEEAAKLGKLNEEGVQALAVLLSIGNVITTSLSDEGKPTNVEFDVAATARLLVGSLEPNASLDLGERTVRKNGTEDQTVVVVSDSKGDAELSDEKVSEHAKRMAASIGQG